MYVWCHVCIYVIFVIFWYLFISLIFISYMSCFPVLVLYILMKFMLNYTHEMHQHQWFIIVVYFVHVFHCTYFIFLQVIFQVFQLNFSFFHAMLISTQWHGSEKHWWHNSVSMHGYLLTSTKRSFWELCLVMIKFIWLSYKTPHHVHIVYICIFWNL